MQILVDSDKIFALCGGLFCVVSPVAIVAFAFSWFRSNYRVVSRCKGDAYD